VHIVDPLPPHEYEGAVGGKGGAASDDTAVTVVEEAQKKKSRSRIVSLSGFLLFSFL